MRAAKRVALLATLMMIACSTRSREGERRPRGYDQVGHVQLYEDDPGDDIERVIGTITVTAISHGEALQLLASVAAQRGADVVYGIRASGLPGTERRPQTGSPFDNRQGRSRYEGSFRHVRTWQATAAVLKRTTPTPTTTPATPTPPPPTPAPPN